ncbi:DUF898 domain-containing protein [Sphingomonas crocodyli]|uniref:DUF898 domain-containing protein n=2 Tax=Sphingomonas crocodyli TaxID=1979270 RepID=A0A437MBH9_9SPHN|nr:YjgN family protein [Sphingomonas crocodyli]RVT95004.1 DUF898 domain-containing protein [Sphingomonas crocodyli]
MDEDQGASGAFVFNGNWREFAPIALTNLLLMIVTLGIYRFWAKARERRYLWSRTDFIGDPLEWTGTGKELFVGFLFAILLIGPPVLVLQFGLQALIVRGHPGAAFLIGMGAYVVLLYLIGVARFRGLRYRLSRTYWHGIRGGSDVQGWRYGISYFWKTVVGSLAAGLLIPWSMISLWNERWGSMSFGPHRFESYASQGPIFGRFMLFYLLPVVGCVGVVGTAAMSMGGAAPADPAKVGIMLVAGVVAAYLAIGVIALAFYAAFFREGVGHLLLGKLRFHFDARTIDWFKLILGHAGLVIVTLGIGLVFISYRNWAFFIRHMAASGEVTLAEMTQSPTAAPRQGEGLLDAFDVGAF